MKNFLISLAVLIIIVLIIFFNYSEKNYKYSCKQESINESIELVMKLTEYRWWIFWGKSDGYINVEIPNKKFGYFGELDINGDNVLIYKSGNIAGRFSKLTNYLYLDSDYFSFNGKCFIK
ncbi:MAG: hypothetical protein ACOX0H_02975 [Patescibacteria group bacterium]|jgi:hypothetical protein